MTITGPISQYTCWRGRRQSTQYWRTVTTRPMHIVQSTSAERKINPVFNGQDPMNLNLQELMGRPILEFGQWTIGTG
eukprot:3382546-Amphidinium_carterae.1